jgi:transposase
MVAAAIPCPECQRLQAQLEQQRAQLEQQRAQLEQQRAQLETMQATMTRLEEQLAAARKSSSTSSKPPSSDIVKPPPPPPPAGQEKRHIGGQPGHPKHERAMFPPEALTSPPHYYTLEICPHCGHDLEPANVVPHVVQQIDIHEVPLVIEEHRGMPFWCENCQKIHYADLPAEIERGGLVGRHLTTLIAYLKGFCHASYATIRKFLRDVLKVTISRGQLAKVIAKVSAALEEPYDELLENLPGQPDLNVDETGHKNNKQRMWTWCFRASLYTLFKIDPFRRADVLMEVLGKEFAGVLGCDHFSAYRRYMRECGVAIQFCLAHLIRDVKFLMTLPDNREQAYGQRLRQALRQLFGVIHNREKMTADQFQSELKKAREEVLQQGTQNVPPTRHAQTMAKRLTQYGESYFTFITTPGVQPTNNLAEQAIRFVVIDRRITQGTRSKTGQRWCERIWTVIATCTQQGRSVFEYLTRAIEAHFHGEKAPSLLPQPG